MFIGMFCFLPSSYSDKDGEDEILSFGLKDSKQLSAKKRDLISLRLKDQSFWFYRVVSIPAEEIDQAVNINDLNDMYVCKAVNSIFEAQGIKDGAVFFVDGNRKVKGLPFESQIAKPKLDATSCSVAAASILAKHAQEKYMQKLHVDFPQYNFAKHNGYGTKEHFEMIKKYGLHKEHRKSWISKDKI